MSVELYDLTVPQFLQGLVALQGVLKKGRAYAEAEDLDVDEFAVSRLAPDMFALNLQVQRAVTLSLGALRDIESGALTMPSRDELNYAQIEALVSDAVSTLNDFTRERVNARTGESFSFVAGPFNKEFTSEAYAISFVIPSFYFHVTTAYDILRAKGVPLGKMDYLGALRTTLS